MQRVTPVWRAALNLTLHVLASCSTWTIFMLFLVIICSHRGHVASESRIFCAHSMQNRWPHALAMAWAF
jgi:hypothetical protein